MEPKKIKVNDKVFITNFYKSNYPSWKVSEGIVTKLYPERRIKTSSLCKEDLATYSNHYGAMEEFPIVSFLVEIGADTYQVSQLGFDLL